MNRMQKIAWLGCLSCLTISVLFAAILIVLFLSPAYLKILFCVLCIVAAALFIAIVWIHRKKQSPAEPEFDERDSLIARRSVIVSFTGLCLLIFISDALLILWTGIEGVIPISILPVIHLILGLLTVTLYYASVIILYGNNIKEAEGEIR